MIIFASSWNSLLKHCISADFLLMEGYVQGAIQMELHIAPLVKHFKTATSRRSSRRSFFSTWNNLLKHWISAEFLLVKGYVQGALRKEMRIAPFVERFKTATLGKS